jgi:hypothetical protein
MLYKSIECYYFHHSICTRGDRCRFRHGENDPMIVHNDIWVAPLRNKWLIWTKVPHPLLNIEVNVNYGIRYYQYMIKGDKGECMKYYNKYILSSYPNNPYFTRIKSEGPDFIHITRSTTSS